MTTTEKCMAAYEANKPEGWSIKFRGNLTGKVWYKQKRAEFPIPTTRRRLYVFFHELGHIQLGHYCGKKHSYIMEYEAEQFAMAKMREVGIPVPKKEVERAKRYVAYKLRMGKRRGLRTVNKKIERWAMV